MSRLRKIEPKEEDQKSTMDNENFDEIMSSESSEPALTEPERNEVNNEMEDQRIEFISPNDDMNKAIEMGHAMQTNHSS